MMYTTEKASSDSSEKDVHTKSSQDIIDNEFIQTVIDVLSTDGKKEYPQNTGDNEEDAADISELMSELEQLATEIVSELEDGKIEIESEEEDNIFKT